MIINNIFAIIICLYIFSTNIICANRHISNKNNQKHVLSPLQSLIKEYKNSDNIKKHNQILSASSTINIHKNNNTMKPKVENLMKLHFTKTIRNNFVRNMCGSLHYHSITFMPKMHEQVGDFGFIEELLSIKREKGKGMDKPFPGFQGPVDLRTVQNTEPNRQLDYGKLKARTSWEQIQANVLDIKGKLPSIDVPEPFDNDPIFAWHVKQVTEALMTCYDRKDVPVWKSIIRPGLIRFRDEVLKTIPGATTWLNEGITKLLTESKKSVEDIARLYVGHLRVIEKSPARDPYTTPSTWAKLFDEEWCHVSDPCSPDERCLIWQLMLLGSLGADDKNSSPTDKGEMVKPPAKSKSDIVGTDYWCRFPKRPYEVAEVKDPELKGIEHDPQEDNPVEYTPEPDIGASAESTQSSNMAWRPWGY